MTRTPDWLPNSGRGAVTAIVMMSDSGDLASEFESGKVILSFSGGLNCVVHMKKMRSRNATSTIGVMSIEIPMRRFFLSIASWLLPLVARCRQELNGLVRGLVHHVVEVVHSRDEHVVRHDSRDRAEQAARGVDERLRNADRELGGIHRPGVSERRERANHPDDGSEQSDHGRDRGDGR